jgi:uncharacterized protein YjbI with pentapeptide repeats
MKKITLIALMLFTALGYAQVGINTNTPNASSALDIESTTGGILIPRLTETQRDAIVSPASGLMIYQTDETSGFYFYNGTLWTKIDGVAGPQGLTGPQGPAGPQGLAGAQGPTGPQGDQGIQGDTGAQGPVGSAGVDGVDGAQGVQGDQGIQGETGTQGPIGPTGSIGAAGAPGAQGPAGVDGAQGLVGPPGNAGSAGNGIVSATDNNNGTFTLSFDDGTTFTTSDLTGPSGETGPQGIQGESSISSSAAPARSLIRLMIQNGSNNFTNSDLYSADLSGIDLTGIDFSGATFTGVSSGNVSGNPTLPPGYSIVNGYIVGPRVDLSNADLINQDLSGVDLSGVDLSGADLSGADMTNAILPSEFANIKKIEIKKSIGGHQTIRAMHFIVDSDSGEFDAARPAYATASTTNVNHQSPNFGGTRDIIHMIGDNKTDTNNYTYNGGDTGTILFNTPYNISEFKEMTIYGWAQFGGGYYNRIADTQYILYTENNVKIYDFTTPSEHSNGDQKAIYRIAGPDGISDGSIWTADADDHFANVNYSGGHYTLDITVSPLVTIEN